MQVERKDLEKQMGDLGLEMDNKDDVRDHLIPFSSFFFFFNILIFLLSIRIHRVSIGSPAFAESLRPAGPSLPKRHQETQA